MAVFIDVSYFSKATIIFDLLQNASCHEQFSLMPDISAIQGRWP
jgi:hypothetical protein